MMLSLRSEDNIDIYNVQIVSVSVKAATFVSFPLKFSFNYKKIIGKKFHPDSRGFHAVATQAKRTSIVRSFIHFLDAADSVCNSSVDVGNP
jgi:hypothetical protein